MNVVLTEAGDLWRLQMIGSVGIEQISRLTECARTIADSGRSADIDLGEAIFLHYAVVQVLLSLKATLEDQGLALHVGAPCPALAGVLNHLGLREALGIAA